MDLYRDQMLDHCRHPRNYKKISAPTHQAHALNPLCGDELDIFLTIHDGIITDIGFQSQSCAVTMATASLVTEQLQGQSVSQALTYTIDTVQQLLGITLSTARVNCANVVLLAIQDALSHDI